MMGQQLMDGPNCMQSRGHPKVTFPFTECFVPIKPFVHNLKGTLKMVEPYKLMQVISLLVYVLEVENGHHAVINCGLTYR